MLGDADHGFAVGFSTRTHSWEVAYFSSLGIWLICASFMLLDRFNKMGRRRSTLTAINDYTSGWPLRTKAGLVTFTVTCFLRISTWACSPISRGTRARAML